MRYKVICVIYICIFAVIVVSCVNCKSNKLNHENETECDAYHTKAVEFLNYYFFSNNTDEPLLDSALFYVNYALDNYHCDSNAFGLTMRKIQLLSFKHDYAQALSIIKSIEWNIIGQPYYKDWLIKRFQAMQSLYNGDTTNCKEKIQFIVTELNDYVVSSKIDINKVLKKEAETRNQDTNFIPILQLYYYKHILYNLENNVTSEDGIKNIFDLNPIFFEDDVKEALKSDFLLFGGY